MLLLFLPKLCLCFHFGQRITSRPFGLHACHHSLSNHDDSHSPNTLKQDNDEFAHLVDSHPLDDPEPCLPSRPWTKTNPRNIPIQQDDEWEWFYSKLKARNNATGQDTDIMEESLLRNWMAQQRKSFMKTLGVLDLSEKANWGTSYLSRQRKERLDELCFPWGHLQPSTLQNDFIYSDDFQRRVRLKYKDWLWSDFYQKLIAFKTQHGHTSVPLTGEHVALGRWAAQQRRVRWTMPERRRVLLDRVQMDWDAREDENKDSVPAKIEQGDGEKVAFATRLKQLKEYRKMHGDCNVPIDSALGKWVSRMQGRRSKLSPSTIKKLELIGLVFHDEV